MLKRHIVLEKFLNLVCEIVNGKLRIYEDGYTIDIFKGNKLFYSVNLDSFGIYQNTEEFRLKQNKARNGRKQLSDDNQQQNNES